MGNGHAEGELPGLPRPHSPRRQQQGRRMAGKEDVAIGEGRQKNRGFEGHGQNAFTGK